MRKYVALGSILTILVTGLIQTPASAHDPWGWILADDPGLELIPSDQATTDHPNECEGAASTPRYNGTDPDWVRVGGNPDPSTPFVEASGQVLSDGPRADESYNPRVTHDDNFWSHWSQDFNVWLTLDPEDRDLLGTGNMGGSEDGEGSGHREHARLEAEWERGAIPLFAWPALGDRMTIWGTHIWDCGHPPYRTEIHPPVGWVTYRQTADSDNSPCIPGTGDCSKRFQTPWNWYAPTDLQGGTARFADPSMPRVPIQATVADAFFSDFGGWTPISLNGCVTASPPGRGTIPPAPRTRRVRATRSGEGGASHCSNRTTRSSSPRRPNRPLKLGWCGNRRTAARRCPRTPATRPATTSRTSERLPP